MAGGGAVKLQDTWRGGIEAYHGVTVSAFPNFFLLLGPNTGLGHNSVIFHDRKPGPARDELPRLLGKENGQTIEVRASALRRFNDRIQRRLGRAVWSQGGCTSWYLDADGVNRTLWPGFSFEYWVRTRRARRADYVIR